MTGNKRIRFMIPLLLLICAILAGCSKSSGKKADYSAANIGDIISFGCYEQDNNITNDPEVIEWLVLDIKDGKALILSKYALDGQPYHSNEDVTWETSSLRKWLNETFLNTAFTEEERSRIELTAVTADKNPSYDTPPGNDTTDRVFLLSISEFEAYCGSDDAKICLLTEYSKAQKARTAYRVNGLNTWWWLRTPGDTPRSVAYVDEAGSLVYDGLPANNGYDAVRPAMWIRLQ